MYEINTKTEDTYLYDPWGLYGGLIMEFEELSEVQWNPAITKCHGTEKTVRYSGVFAIAKTPL